MLDSAEAYWRKAPDQLGCRLTPTSIWRATGPRSCQSDRYEQSTYPFTPILKGNTPQLFQSALARAKAFMDSHANVPKILTINSWNESTEGSHLEPEALYGTDYLDAIRSVFGGQ